jgi:prepilin peptidase CpaA
VSHSVSEYGLLMCLPALALVAVAAATDWRSRRIPNWLTFSLALAGIAQSIAFGATCTPLDSILGLGVGFSLTFILYALRAVQGGDVKLMAGIGAWLGPWGAFELFLVEAIVGAAMVVAQAIAQRRARRLLGNTALLVVNLVHVRRLGLDHVAATGQSSRTVELRLPYAVPVLIALVILLAHPGSPLGGW